MKKSHRKDPASHPDPESCGGGRETTGEALTGAHTGQPSSCEIHYSGVPTPWTYAEGNTVSDVIGESPADPAQSKTLSMCGNSLHGNREIPGVPLPTKARAGWRRPLGRTSSTYAPGESDDPIVPTKRANNVGPSATAESAEGRGSSEGTVLTVDHVPYSAPDQAGRIDERATARS